MVHRFSEQEIKRFRGDLMSMIKDISGQRFGSFLVVEPTDRKNAKQQKFWKCKCLICGKHYEVRGDNLRRGVSTKCSTCYSGRGRASREVV